MAGEKYQIVALLNSTVAAAQAAIAAYGLPAETRAYGDPNDLADDKDIQLVVNITRADNHHRTILPSLAAGKDAFVEWPLASNIEQIRELSAIARSGRVRTMVGFQGRLAPVFQKVKQALLSGAIGKVVSSEVKASGISLNQEALPVRFKYFTERVIGANAYTIGFAHCELS